MLKLPSILLSSINFNQKIILRLHLLVASYTSDLTLSVDKRLSCDLIKSAEILLQLLIWVIEGRECSEKVLSKTPTTQGHWGFQGEVLPKSLYFYQVCKLRNTTTSQVHRWVPEGGPRENPMSLSSP